MTNENKQALENFLRGLHHVSQGGKLPKESIERNQKIDEVIAALQQKPSVDVEVLHLVLENCEASGSTYKERIDMIHKIVSNHLQSQGHLTQGWRDIESAPKDGEILVFCPNGISGHRERKYEVATWSEKWGWFHNSLHNNLGGTHWMPLPQPPKSEDA